MDCNIYDNLIPAIVILIANIFSVDHESISYKRVTKIFLSAFFISILLIFFFYFTNKIGRWDAVLLKIAGFCLITALARDYERVIKKIIRLFSNK
jgi:hypothetical protein